MKENQPAFGMLMRERTYSSATYRFGFNGKEKTDEVNGEGNALDFGARIFDPRLGRFLSPDPLSVKYVSISLFCYAANCPIALIDIYGMGPGIPKPPHSEYFTSSAITLYNAAKAKGATGAGIFFVLAHAATETGYSTTNKTDFNYFNIKGSPHGRAATDGGYFKDYSGIGGANAALEDYFKTIDGNAGWTGMDLIKKETITSDDIDKAFNTGEYFPTAEQQHKGIGCYAGANKASALNYGKTILQVMKDNQKMMIAALDYEVSSLDVSIANLQSKINQANQERALLSYPGDFSVIDNEPYAQKKKRNPISDEELKNMQKELEAAKAKQNELKNLRNEISKIQL